MEQNRVEFVATIQRLRAEQLWEADYALFQKVGLVGMKDPAQKARTLLGLKARALISYDE